MIGIYFSLHHLLHFMFRWSFMLIDKFCRLAALCFLLTSFSWYHVNLFLFFVEYSLCATPRSIYFCLIGFSSETFYRVHPYLQLLAYLFL